MNAITLKRVSELSEFLQTAGTFRVTKNLDNGNMAIIQVVDPDAVPVLTHWLREQTGTIAKYARALDAAARVAVIVFRNALRTEPKPPRKPRKPKPQKSYNWQQHKKGEK